MSKVNHPAHYGGDMVDEAAAALAREAAEDAATRLNPGRTIIAVLICMLVMIGCAAGVAHGETWCAIGIPLAPLVAVALTCSRRLRA